jgi:hypothetical protein
MQLSRTSWWSSTRRIILLLILGKVAWAEPPRRSVPIGPTREPASVSVWVILAILGPCSLAIIGVAFGPSATGNSDSVAGDRVAPALPVDARIPLALPRAEAWPRRLGGETAFGISSYDSLSSQECSTAGRASAPSCGRLGSTGTPTHAAPSPERCRAPV